MGIFRPRARHFCRDTKVPKKSPGLRPRTQGCPTEDVCFASGAQNLTLLPRLPGLPGPAWAKNRTSPPLSFCAFVSQLCTVVPALAAPPRCAAPDSSAPRIRRPRRATSVKGSRSRFCSLSWWGYKVSPVKQTGFKIRTGRVRPSRFCKVRPTQGRGTPVTGSGVGPVEAEGAARGRFGLTPAAFWLLCRRGQSNSPRRAKSLSPIN